MSEGSIHKALRLRWADQKDWPPHVACFIDRGGMGLGSILCRHAVLQVFTWGFNVFSHLGKWQIFRRRCSGYRDVSDRTNAVFSYILFFPKHVRTWSARTALHAKTCWVLETNQILQAPPPIFLWQVLFETRFNLDNWMEEFKGACGHHGHHTLV